MKERNKLLLLTLSLMLLVPLVAGCSGEPKQNEQERVLRIGVLYGGGDEQYIRQQYTDIFEYTNGGISIDIVPAVDTSGYRYADPAERDKNPDPVGEMQKLMTGANPVDVVILDTDAFQEIVRDGNLKQLDPLIQKDNFDTSDIIPSVLDTIKTMGDGNIYGLAPTFSSNALFYNKTLFKEAGVDPPHDNMTWDEVFDLARRVANGEGKDRTFGFGFNRYPGDNAFWSVSDYVKPLQMRLFDDKAERMTINTPQWEHVYGTLAKLSQDHVLPGQNDDMESSGEYSPLNHDLFLSGRVAMMLGYYGYTSKLLDASKHAGNIKGLNMPEWDVVTVPHHPEAPGISSGMSFNTITAINTEAQNPDDAWKFIQFINSEEWAKIRSRSSHEMVSRKSYIKPKEGLNFNIQSFYAMKPSPNNAVEINLRRQANNLYTVESAGYELFDKVIKGKMTTAEMLKEWETKGNALLLAIKKNPNGPIGKDDDIMKGVYGD